MMAFAAVGVGVSAETPALAIAAEQHTDATMPPESRMPTQHLRRVNLIERSEIRARAKRSPPRVPDRAPMRISSSSPSLTRHRPPVTAIRPKPPYGVEYEVRIEIDGLNAVTHPVVTGWLVPDDGPPRLLTAYVELPAVPSRRRGIDAWEAGTVATVLEVMPESVLAEIADEEGRTLEVLTVPVDAARRPDLDGVPKRPESASRTLKEESCRGLIT